MQFFAPIDVPGLCQSLSFDGIKPGNDQNQNCEIRDSADVDDVREE